jgi:hypothetical protein
MSFGIEKNIPIPQDAYAGNLVWPLNQMNPGDSVFVAGKTIYQASSRIAQVKSKKGWKFTSRTVTENGVTGVRIWRTE